MTNGNDLINVHVNQSEEFMQLGLTKREYFAAMAMQGILCNSNESICNNITVNDGWQHSETVAGISIKMADALINELNKPQPE